MTGQDFGDALRQMDAMIEKYPQLEDYIYESIIDTVERYEQAVLAEVRRQQQPTQQPVTPVEQGV
jgi:hypothetical protein